MNRRKFLLGALAATTALVAPVKAFPQPIVLGSLGGDGYDTIRWSDVNDPKTWGALEEPVFYVQSRIHDFDLAGHILQGPHDFKIIVLDPLERSWAETKEYVTVPIRLRGKDCL